MTSPVQQGDLVAGKYRVDRILGEGGMGVVVAATHEQLEQKVALKFLLPTVSSMPEVVQRFIREARAAVKIQSEHVARVLDVGTLENGTPYMVMEYLEGSDAAQLLAERGPLPVAESVGWVLQACEAIAEAHALGIVHRDLKPANLFLAKRPTGKPIVKVLDFGISKISSSSAAKDAVVTHTTAVMGSPGYMSPEQMMASHAVDVRSDVWSLGIVLYELLTHKLPFMGDTMPELVAKILQAPPQPLSSTRDDVPIGLQAVVDKCLRKEPAERYANVAELARALAPFGPPRSDQSVERIEHVLGVAREAMQPAAAPAGTATGLRVDSLTFSPITSQSSLPRNARILLPVGLLAAAVLSVVAFVALRSSRHESRPASSSPLPSASIAGPVTSTEPAASAPPPASTVPPPIASSVTLAPPPPPTAPTAWKGPVTHPSATTQPPPAAASSTPACHVVSYFDADGNKHFKQVCP